MHTTVFIRCFIILLCWIISINTVFSQEKEKVKLIDHLEKLEKDFGVSFSYSYSFLDTLLVPKSNNCPSIEACIQEITKVYPLLFKKSQQNNYLILPIRQDVQFTAMDIETSESITYLNIAINNKSDFDTYSDEKLFTIKDLFPLDSITIKADSYRSIQLLGSDLIALKSPLSFQREEIALKEVVITRYLTKGIDAKLSDQSLQIDMSSLGLLAGETDGDVFNILKNIPGIRTPDGKPGSINFRGSTFDQTLFQMDDIPIYHTGHFFGTLSPYNPTAANHIEIQRNTLHAKWGGRVGGLINITTTNKIPDSTSYNITLNTLYAGATIRTQLLKNKLGISISGRSSYPNFQSPKLEAFSSLNFQGSRIAPIASEVNSSSENFDVFFYDINAKLVYDFSENHTATISFINIENRLSVELLEMNTNQTDFQDLDLDNWGVTAKWKGKLSNKLRSEVRFSKSSLTISNVTEGFQNQQMTGLEKNVNIIDDTRLINETTYQISPTTALEAGYTYTEHKLRFDNQTDANNIPTRRDQNGSVHSLYLSSQKNWKKRITTNIGLHTDYYEPTDKFYIDPRISINIGLNNGIFLKSSAGRSHQFIQKKLQNDFDDFRVENQFWFLPDRSTFTLESYQAMIGALYNKRGWLIDVELYYKNTDNVSTRSGPEIDQKGTLRSIGTDFFIKKRWGKLESWFSYSLSKVTTDFVSTESAFYDQRHILNITGLLYLDRWNFAITWGYFSGMPVIIPELDPDLNNGQTAINVPYSNRFPNQHQLDLSATYTFFNKAKTWKSSIGLSFVNLYDQDNIINIFQNNTRANNLYRKAVGFSPNLQLNFSF